jgi:hypothetical protein
MRSKLVTMLLVGGLVAGGGVAGVVAQSPTDEILSSVDQYRPGKGCGDRQHTHTGPLGNPTNTDCPPRRGR